MPFQRKTAEQGVTFIEVLIASILTLVLLIMGYEILGTSTRTANAISFRSVNSANAREAINALEANLRFASGEWVCGGSPATATCATPTANVLASWSRTSTATLYVTNASGGTQPSCDEWTVTAAGLQEDHVSGSTVTTIFTLPGVMAWVPPYASATSSTQQSTGFSSGVAGQLVELDLLVNSVAKTTDSAKTFDTADAVSVHDFVAPDDLPAFSSALSTAATITSLPVVALANSIGAGSGTITYTLPTGTVTSQTFTTTGASAGANSIPVTSLQPNYAYPITSTVTFPPPLGSC
jgi:hypothetical protein